MPTLLTGDLKYLAVALAVVTVFFAGMQFQSGIDARRASDLIQAQQSANAMAQAELDAKAKAAEAALAAERIKSADLATQWEKERHAKNHAVCTLSAATLRVLQAASGQ